MIKVTYIISDIDKAVAFEWIASYLNKDKFRLSFILLNPASSHLEQYLLAHNFETHSIRCSGKKDWLSALLSTYKSLKKLKPHVVHCHLLQANIIGLTAAKIAGVKKRIYTRHHSSLHHVYFKKGVLWDKYANKLATHIIAISGIVKEILVNWEGVAGQKILLIPHGFSLEEFSDVGEERVAAVKKRYSLEEGYIVGVISRLTEWKGIQFVIPAFKNFLKTEPGAVLAIFNAKGDFEPEIKSLLADLPAENYRLIPFEHDIAAAYQCMHVFVHTPVDEHSEAFGQVYVEALAAGKPSIFTLSGIASDFVKNECNAFVVPFKNEDAIYKQLIKIYSDPSFADKVAKRGREDVATLFPLGKMINALEDVYERG